MPTNIDWNKLQDFEKEDNTKGSQELACTAGVCELVDIQFVHLVLVYVHQRMKFVLVVLEQVNKQLSGHFIMTKKEKR